MKFKTLKKGFILTLFCISLYIMSNESNNYKNKNIQKYNEENEIIPTNAVFLENYDLENYEFEDLRDSINDSETNNIITKPPMKPELKEFSEDCDSK